MECRLLLFFIVVLCLKLVECHYPTVYQHGTSPQGRLGNGQTVPQHPYNVNNHANYMSLNSIPQTPAIQYNPTGERSRNHALHQHNIQTNLAKSPLINNFYQKSPTQVAHGHSVPQYDTLAKPQIQFSELQGYERTGPTEMRGKYLQNQNPTLNDRKIPQSQQIPTLQSVQQWNGQRLPQHYGNIGNLRNIINEPRKDILPAHLQPINQKIPQHNLFGTLPIGNNIPSEGWWNGQKLPRHYGNYVNLQSVHDEPRKEFSPPVPQPNGQKSPQYNQISTNNIPSEGWWNGQKLPELYNNFAIPQGVYTEPQSYQEVPPPVGETKIPRQISTTSGENNIPSDTLWFGQRLPQQQQNQIFKSPSTPFIGNYPEPYQRLHNGNYDQEYPQFQTPTPLISNGVNNFPTYGQEWPTTVPYQEKSTPAPVEYLQWPPNEDNSFLPSDPRHEANIDSENSKPAYPYNPVDEIAQLQVDPIPFTTDPFIQKNIMQIGALHQTVNDSNINSNYSFKRNITAHANGTYELTNNLDDMEINEFNIAYIKSKDRLHHILFIAELDYEIPETKTKEPFELPYDTGISKLPIDTSWNTRYQDSSPSPSNYRKLFDFCTERTQTTTENPDIINYFKQEYIMPIQSTTEKSIRITTNTELPTTYINGPITEPNVETKTQNTPHTTGIPKVNQNINNEDLTYNEVDIIYFEPSDEGTAPFDFVNQYYEPGTEQMETIQPSTFETKSDGQTTSNKNEENVTDNPNSLPSTISTHDMYNNLENDIGESTPSHSTTVEDAIYVTSRPDETIIKGPIATTTYKPAKLRDDLEIDASELKTVSKPLVWFRPDEKFWEKVTEGENGYDKVTFYDVRCKPKLVERETTVHHYPNGTEIIEYVETFWDHIGDLTPKEVNSKRVVNHPDA